MGKMASGLRWGVDDDFPSDYPANPVEGQGLEGVTDPLVNQWVSPEVDAPTSPFTDRSLWRGS